MIRSAAKILHEYGPFPGVDHGHRVTFDGRTCGLRPETNWAPSILRAGQGCARSMSPCMRKRPSTAGTCFSSPRITFRRSIRRPAVCSPRSRRPAAAVTRVRVGRRDALGGAVSGPEDPSNRSPNRGASSHHRGQPLRRNRSMKAPVRRRRGRGSAGCQFQGSNSAIRRAG